MSNLNDPDIDAEVLDTLTCASGRVFELVAVASDEGHALVIRTRRTPHDAWRGSVLPVAWLGRVEMAIAEVRRRAGELRELPVHVPEPPGRPRFRSDSCQRTVRRRGSR